MASLRLRPTSAFWWACFRLPTGAAHPLTGAPVFRRVQRSTGTADRGRAQQIALSFERAAVLAAERQFTDRTARAFLAELAAVSGSALHIVEPVGDFLGRWLAARAPSLAAHTRERYALAVAQFSAFLGAAAVPIAEITAHRVAAFRDAETAAGKSPATVNKALSILAAAFEEAVAQGLLDRNPARGLNVRGAARARQRRSAFTFPQFEALVAATEGEWRTLVLLCGYTGARQQEAAQLTWPQVDLSGRRITLSRTKTADTHWLPLHPALAAHLRSVRPAGRAPAGPVLPWLCTLRRRAVSNYFRRDILPRIGLAQPFAPRTAAKGAGRILAPYSLHSLRHALGTWLHAAGVPEMMRMRLIGHSDVAVSRGYTHTDLAAAAAELGKIAAVKVPRAPAPRAGL